MGACFTFVFIDVMLLKLESRILQSLRSYILVFFNLLFIPASQSMALPLEVLCGSRELLDIRIYSTSMTRMWNLKM